MKCLWHILTFTAPWTTLDGYWLLCLFLAVRNFWIYSNTLTKDFAGKEAPRQSPQIKLSKFLHPFQLRQGLKAIVSFVRFQNGKEKIMSCLLEEQFLPNWHWLTAKHFLHQLELYILKLLPLLPEERFTSSPCYMSLR